MNLVLLTTMTEAIPLAEAKAHLSELVGPGPQPS